MDLFVIILVFVLIVLYVKNHMSEVTYVKAKNDDQTFLVRRLPDKQQAADLLSDITNDLTKFVNQLTAKYPDNENIKRLYRNFNPKNVSEYKAGNAKALNGLVGPIMKASKGKANPAQVNALLLKKLG